MYIDYFTVIRSQKKLLKDKNQKRNHVDDEQMIHYHQFQDKIYLLLVLAMTHFHQYLMHVHLELDQKFFNQFLKLNQNYSLRRQLQSNHQHSIQLKFTPVIITKMYSFRFKLKIKRNLNQTQQTSTIQHWLVKETTILKMKLKC